MLTENNSTVCRTCLTSVGDFFDIFSKGAQHTTIAATIMECAPVKISVNDALPNSICSMCVDKLQTVSQFRSMCMQSDATLRCQIQSSITSTPNTTNTLNSINYNQVPVKVEIDPENQANEWASETLQNNQEENKPNESTITEFCDRFLESSAAINNPEEDLTESSLPEDPIENAVLEYYKKRKEVSIKKGLDKTHKQKEKKIYESKDKVYKCELCDKQLKSWNSFQVHKRGHTGEKPYECDICFKKFTQKANVERHKLVLHSNFPKPVDTRPVEKKYECLVCSRKFRYNYVLKTHMRIHTGDKQSMCDTCGKKFHHPDNLKKHMMIHTGERNYKCDICKKDFIWLGNLKKHYRSVHQDYRPYQCNVCMKTFQQRWYLRSHMLVHTGEKNYKCDVCDKKFAKSYTLTEHKRIHTGEKPYKCEACGKSFTQRGPLRAHLKSHVIPNDELLLSVIGE